MKYLYSLLSLREVRSTYIPSPLPSLRETRSSYIPSPLPSLWEREGHQRTGLPAAGVGKGRDIIRRGVKGRGVRPSVLVELPAVGVDRTSDRRCGKK